MGDGGDPSAELNQYLDSVEAGGGWTGWGVGRIRRLVDGLAETIQSAAREAQAMSILFGSLTQE